MSVAVSSRLLPASSDMSPTVPRLTMVGWKRESEDNMKGAELIMENSGMATLIWINTVVILFALVGGGVMVMYQLRKISEALVQVGGQVERVEEAAVKIQETASRSERISVAILQRLSVGDNPQA
jgi:hypothetical protein